LIGRRRGSTGSSANPWLFTGEQHDGDSDLYYLRARYYDGATGRFLSQDPIGAAEPYAYVSNNPMNYTDPSGLCAFGAPCPKLPEPPKPPNPIEVVEWGATQVGNNVQATGQYVSNVYHRPTTFPQETVGLGFALTSFGDYHTESGVGWWEKCWGSCSWLRLSDADAFALGHSVLSEDTLFRCEKVHELLHVQQSDEHGGTWLVDYGWESIKHGYDGNKFEVDAYSAQDRCESGSGSFGGYSGGPGKE
jgi:RHS repeat-associated protein